MALTGKGIHKLFYQNSLFFRLWIQNRVVKCFPQLESVRKTSNKNEQRQKGERMMDRAQSENGQPRVGMRRIAME